MINWSFHVLKYRCLPELGKTSDDLVTRQSFALIQISHIDRLLFGNIHIVFFKSVTLKYITLHLKNQHIKLRSPLLFRQLCLHSIAISKFGFCLTFECFWLHHVICAKAKLKHNKLWSYYICSLITSRYNFFSQLILVQTQLRHILHQGSQ